MQARQGVGTGSLIDSIYAAALEGADWRLALDGLRNIAGARVAGLLSVEHRIGVPRIETLVSDDAANLESMVTAYTKDFHRLDPTPGLVEKWASGRWFFDTEALSDAVRNRSAYHQEFLRPHGSSHWCGTVVTRTSERSEFMSFVMAPGTTLAPGQQAMLDTLTSHVGRARRLSEQLDLGRQQHALVTALLDAMTVPVLLLDETGLILVDNAAARALGMEHLPMHHGRLQPIGGWQTARERGAFTVVRGDGLKRHFFLTAVPASAQLARDWQRPLWMLTAPSPQSSAERMRRLQTIFPLTRAEAELVTMLASEGLTPQECAEERAVSINTVRTQIKSILLKMGVTRMSMMVRTAMSL
ncbi:hypothetical protein [Xylophilus sp. GOD-11R]|uniref:helix-turn-helix transcriptional regulator n=1 Tax=Xylophilus sp. GOD-11R TaxID=3089814 RepID=UPI00298CA5C5|nr:hypothetical protein [Xylophilus sp. GOD-11R]WPB55163.1 hypothetical protein R9X41_13450 [Xylophilus sp. GOD-11R]